MLFKAEIVTEHFLLALIFTFHEEALVADFLCFFAHAAGAQLLRFSPFLLRLGGRWRAVHVFLETELILNYSSERFKILRNLFVWVSSGCKTLLVLDHFLSIDQ